MPDDLIPRLVAMIEYMAWDDEEDDTIEKQVRDRLPDVGTDRKTGDDWFAAFMWAKGYVAGRSTATPPPGERDGDGA